MQLDLTDQEPRALQVVDHAIETDRYPLSPRIQTLRPILAKFGPLEPPPLHPATVERVSPSLSLVRKIPEQAVAFVWPPEHTWSARS